MNKDEFIEYCNNNLINISESKINKIIRFKELLIEWNDKFNLTTITKEEDIFLKHFLDSIFLCKAVNLDNKKVCDFGTGAGFPGIVLSIIFDSSNYTLIESNSKKVTFLKYVKDTLNLTNVEIINERTEDYGKKNREIFDIVTCRAVSSLKVILELSISLTKINGLFIPMKANIEEELQSLKDFPNKIGYKLEKTIEYELPIEKSKRTLLIYKKFKKTESIYPRNYSTIKKQSKM